MKKNWSGTCAADAARRTLLRGTALILSGFLSMLTHIPASAQPRLQLLLFTLDLSNKLDTTSEWVDWMGRASSALQESELIPPAPLLGGETFDALQEAAHAKARAIEIPTPPSLGQVPNVPTGLSRDSKRQLLAAAMSKLDESSGVAKELTSAMAQLGKMDRRVALQIKQLEYTETVLERLLPELTAAYIGNRIGFAYLNIMGTYIPKFRAIEATIAEKMKLIAEQRKVLAASANAYGSKLVVLLVAEQAELAAERDAFQKERVALSTRADQLYTRRGELRYSEEDFIKLRDNARIASDRAQRKASDLLRIEAQRDHSRRELNELERILARQELCEEKSSTGATYWVPCYRLSNGTLVSRTFVDQKIGEFRASYAGSVSAAQKARRELDSLVQLRDEANAAADNEAELLAKEQALVKLDTEQLAEDVRKFFERAFKSRADAFFAESVEQQKVVTQWLKSY